MNLKEMNGGFADITRQFVVDQGHGDQITPDGDIIVYHGSSESNIVKIIKSGKFKGFPFFALDEETARKFAGQAGGTPMVSQFVVDADSIVPTNGYLSSRNSGLKMGKNNVFTSA